MSLFDWIHKKPLAAAPEPNPTVQGAQTGRPERPILDKAEDRLSRGPFIQRLARALIDPGSKKSTGVVIGITGQWGSGKSSILNLLRKQLLESYPDAAIVSFDPWLISGRNDLISQFLAELIKVLKPNSSAADKARGIADTIAEYGDTLSPGLNLLHPGAAFLGKAGAKGIRALANTDKTLSGLKRQLEKLLAQIDRPIVVLIDELDRVEDHEIRSVAQLVRSVADFSSISYVLAYDPRRVIQALGEGAEKEDREKRGSAYLEKIVQLQVPLPITFGEELIRLLNAELEKLPVDQGLPSDFDKIDRYQELTKVLLEGALQTPRDISRLVGTFHALAGMVGKEVDRIDLLGYCALVAKSPRTVQRIREEPEEFCDDIVSAKSLIRHMEGERTAEQRLKSVLPDDGDQPGTAELLKYLFPVFGDHGRSPLSVPDRISFRRPLLTVLRLGLIPGSYTQQEVEELLTANPEFVTAAFQKAHAADALPGLIDRIDDIYSGFEAAHHIDFWKGVAEFTRKPNCAWPAHYEPMHSLIHDIAGLLDRAIQRDQNLMYAAARIFSNLRSSEDVLTAIWLRSHIFRYSLFGKTDQSSGTPAFLTSDETRALAIDFSKEMRTKQLSGKLIPCRYDLQPVYTMIDTGEWDDPCKKVLQTDIENGHALDGFTLMLYGGNFSIDKSTIRKMVPYDFYIEKVKARVASSEFGQLHESVKVALKKALNPL